MGLVSAMRDSAPGSPQALRGTVPRYYAWAWLDDVCTDADPDDGGHPPPTAC